ncbi:MAG: DUF3098 domain-containing protein [Saprospiraceae bacterium]|nr:DUF3098 domain-containing protein [Saprospiraceae bacterium]MDW8484712.1 DUF3098 domain-containing protein [Saprospiraceae bacterium]
MAKQPQRRAAQPSPSSASRRPTTSTSTSRKTSSTSGRPSELWRKDEPFIFGRRNFIAIGIGLLLIILGLIAMSGGSMPDPNTWDPAIIYSPRRITLAPFLMILGFIVVGIGIFLDPEKASTAPNNDLPA